MSNSFAQKRLLRPLNTAVRECTKYNMYCTYMVQYTTIHCTVQFLAASKKIYEIPKFCKLKFVKAPVFHILKNKAFNFIKLFSSLFLPK